MARAGVERVRLARTTDGFVADRGEGWAPVRAATTADAIEAVRGLEGASSGDDGLALECPVAGPSKIVGVGFNYAAHASELAAPAGPPVLFGKFPSALSGPYAPIPHDPSHTAALDYEVELAAVIGRRARRVRAADAGAVVFGYAVANDVSARDVQERGDLGGAKGADGYCPLGPWIVSADELGAPGRLAIRSWVNGEPRQDGSTADMLLSVGELVERISSFATLEPGDVILTGSPAGSARGFEPPRYLRPGDTVACEIDGIGRIESRVEAVSV
jgi:2-keto-4-pentenoate hydratase/2-oxohepta-3-ene-1,7-dioic acid hydratase in catechol pathway